jgi:hypothetical protein
MSAGLRSGSAEIRRTATETLVRRADSAACETLVRHFDRLDEANIHVVKSISMHISETVIDLLHSSNPEILRGVIATATSLRIADAFERIVHIAEDHTHPLCGFAEDKILDLACQIGEQARDNRDVPSIRQSLLHALFESIGRYQKHRNLSLLDAFLCCSHADDGLLYTVLGDLSHPYLKWTLRQLRLSQRPAIIQLLADLFFRRNCPRQVASLVRERNSEPLAMALARNGEQGLTNAVRRELSGTEPPTSLLTIDIRDDTVSLQRRCAVLEMLSCTTVGPRTVLSGVATMLEINHPWSIRTAVDILRSYSEMSVEDMVRILSEPKSVITQRQSQAGSITSIQESLESILSQLKQTDEPSVRSSIGKFFSDFTVDNALRQAENLPTLLMSSFADVVCRVVPDWQELLTIQLESISPIRRIRAIRALQYFPIDDALWQICCQLVDDPNLKVRLQAISIVAQSQRPEARPLLQRLTTDVNTDLQNAALEYLDYLDGHKSPTKPLSKVTPILPSISTGSISSELPAER